MVRRVNHEIHDGAVAAAFEYRIRLHRLIAEISLQTIHDGITAPLSVHGLKLGPIIAPPPTSKLVHVFLSGQGAFKPSVREEVKKLDLVA
jgi:hypothetical protein